MASSLAGEADKGPNMVASPPKARHIGCVQDLHSGAIVDHYKLLRYLGGGGMGVVYESEDLKLGRRVALKFLSSATLKDPASLERFWREARTASALNHPAICTVHELNESTDPPFLVMELLSGFFFSLTTSNS
jgi:serine/threonine protein kinase